MCDYQNKLSFSFKVKNNSSEFCYEFKSDLDRMVYWFSSVVKEHVRIFNAPQYPFCMLTIQLPSDMPTGPPPTILVLLWTKHPTEDSSPGKVETHFNISHVMHLIYDIYMHSQAQTYCLHSCKTRGT